MRYVENTRTSSSIMRHVGNSWPVMRYLENTESIVRYIKNTWHIMRHVKNNGPMMRYVKNTGPVMRYAESTGPIVRYSKNTTTSESAMGYVGQSALKIGLCEKIGTAVFHFSCLWKFDVENRESTTKSSAILCPAVDLHQLCRDKSISYVAYEPLSALRWKRSNQHD